MKKIIPFICALSLCCFAGGMSASADMYQGNYQNGNSGGYVDEYGVPHTADGSISYNHNNAYQYIDGVPYDINGNISYDYSVADNNNGGDENNDNDSNDDNSLFPDTAATQTVSESPTDSETAAASEESTAVSSENTSEAATSSSSKNKSDSGSSSSKSDGSLGKLIYFLLGTALGAFGTFLIFATVKHMKHNSSSGSLTPDDIDRISSSLKKANQTIQNVSKSTESLGANMQRERENLKKIKQRIDD
ncbi:MAG: hypothetical protein IJ666_03450 [Ruminococcus sp.]|nr:hypothetical protein [Ruminococcus sp.]